MHGYVQPVSSIQPSPKVWRVSGDCKQTGGPETAGRCRYELRLYVAGRTPRSHEAFSNLQRICEEHLEGRYSIEVIDLLENPALAKDDRILAVPTLVRRLPEPVRMVIGTLADTERVLIGLDLRPRKRRK